MWYTQYFACSIENNKVIMKLKKKDENTSEIIMVTMEINSLLSDTIIASMAQKCINQLQKHVFHHIITVFHVHSKWIDDFDVMSKKGVVYSKSVSMEMVNF